MKEKENEGQLPEAKVSAVGRYEIGNFIVQKYTKSLNRAQMKAVRMDELFNVEKRDMPKRVSVPYIKVMSVSDNWEVHYAVGSVMFRIIEAELASDEEPKKELAALFTMLYADTMVFGDKEYWAAKTKALDDYMARQKTEVDKAEDDKIVEEEATLEQAKETIIDMADQMDKED